MMRTPNDNNDDAPPKLVAALRSAKQEHVFVPPSVDEQIRKAAQEHLERREPFQFRWPHWAAVAACVCLLAFVTVVLIRSGKQSYAREDLNRDGRVDILDAFALAKELQQGKPESKRLDVNHDGVSDQRDVTELAQQAVQIAKRGRS